MSECSSKSTNLSDFGIDEIKINRIIFAISNILDEIIEENLNDGLFPNLALQCYSKNANIKIDTYLHRLFKYCHFEPSTLIICLIYIDRIFQHDEVNITQLNMYKILLGCLIIAIKYNEDDYYSNEFYAKLGGITLDEVNFIESEVVKLLDFKFFVVLDIFDKYRNYLFLYHVKN